MSQQVQVRILFSTSCYYHISPLSKIAPIKTRGIERAQNEWKKKKKSHERSWIVSENQQSSKTDLIFSKNSK